MRVTRDCIKCGHELSVTVPPYTTLSTLIWNELSVTVPPYTTLSTPIWSALEMTTHCGEFEDAGCGAQYLVCLRMHGSKFEVAWFHLDTSEEL
jgi:hypothetical protein